MLSLAGRNELHIFVFFLLLAAALKMRLLEKLLCLTHMEAALQFPQSHPARRLRLWIADCFYSSLQRMTKGKVWVTERRKYEGRKI